MPARALRRRLSTLPAKYACVKPMILLVSCVCVMGLMTDHSTESLTLSSVRNVIRST